MKVQIILFAALVAVALAAKDGGYTTKFDNVDLDQILASDRLLKNYHKCLMEKGPCTPDGTELKKSLPDALANDCSKCSEKQKNGSDKVIKYLIANKPAMWAELEKKYDPTGDYLKRSGLVVSAPKP